MAERADWEVAEAQGLDLTAVNPGWILGPLLDAQSGTSVALIQRFLKGSDPMMPDFGFPVVDVRDVVLAHVRALQDPTLIGERIIVAAGTLSLPEIGQLLKKTYPERKIPTRTAPKLMVRLLGFFMPEMRQLVPQLGHRQRVSNARAQRLLGVNFIAPEEALRTTARDLIQMGLV